MPLRERASTALGSGRTSVRCALDGSREQNHCVLKRLEGVPFQRDHRVVARSKLRSIGRRDDPSAAANQLERQLAGVLVLVEYMAGRNRDQRLPQRMDVSSTRSCSENGGYSCRPAS